MPTEHQATQQEKAYRQFLEGVMNFDSEAIAFWHGKQKTLPKRRLR